ncbi:basement membrane-specific heparan sulfate proteoglycan core protein-like [Elysia marginata]|uniref:Basement membrane-specific heparan sulfate proteoglycan core protein-like n=1 Tax=Elysia marginata TaxID=1093978 RepID=A0AAV4EN93_9GAST|nr:basement membrane-specific heparan sulfate proteoglycan core protein-like [Elysia marginata]
MSSITRYKKERQSADSKDSSLPDKINEFFVWCTCRATSDGYPRGSAQWYKGDQPVGTNGDLDITYNKNNPEQVYTCEAKSALGRKPGSTLRAKFAFIDPDSVQIASSSSKVNLCDNNNQVQVTCDISRDHVSPAPTFSFSVDGPRSQGPQPGTDSSDGNYYQTRFSLSPDVGGQYQVTCRVTITVTNTWQNKSTQITFNKPPPSPPQVTVAGLTYQGISPSNIVTLAEGYTGDVTCRVEGGYPGAHTTQLKCGQLENTGDGNTATVRFTTDTLTKELDRTVCTCTSQHDSGCYNNKETRFKLNVLYAPEVTFTKSSASTEFNKGDNLDFICSAQGNPDPTSVILTRERNGDIITRVQTAELTYELDSLDCLDTDVYVCSGQNSQGTTSKEISISVNCAQQFSPLFSPSPKVYGVLGETAEVDIEIYGFPEPSLTLHRTVENTNITSSPRHEVKYTSTVAPFGFVNVTISDLVVADYTNYILTIDNGVGDALVYSFYLNQDAPEVTFTKSSPSTEFNKGDNLDLTCSAQGNPDPTSVTLTRERNDDIITRVQAAELTYTLDSLDCLDTGVYVCSGQNSQGTTSKEISISVNCKYC